MLEARSLSKRYAGVAAVHDVSFCIQPGQILGYLGPNGAGKSTTVKMITGLIKPSAGHVFFQGRDVHSDLKDFKRRLGYVPEEANLYPHLSGREYLELVCELRGIPQSRASERIEEYLRLFSLTASRHIAMGNYSKGMRQRILISAALLHNPDLLVLDEPLSGLDVTSVLIFRHLVQELGAHGKAIFYCSHVLEVVEKICTHILVLRKGSVAAYGSTADLRGSEAVQSLEQTFSRLVDEQDAAELAKRLAELTLEAA